MDRYSDHTITLRSSSTFLTLEGGEKALSGEGCLMLYEHQSERGGLQRPSQSCHLWGYHNYLWD
jgi:hypothetical protein